MDICLYWLGIPGIIFVIEGNCLRHVVLVELNSCRPDSLSPFFTLHVERPPAVFWCDELVNCFLTLESDLAVEGGCPPRISADGFILSSQRRIQFPTFRPTSMSLSWIFLWTLITISNIARVRLWYRQSILQWNTLFVLPLRDQEHECKLKIRCTFSTVPNSISRR